jgi:hypothetical protein
MKEVLIIVQVLLLSTYPLQAQNSHSRQPDYYLNGQLVFVDRISLIAPKNIKKIEVIKDVEPPQVRVTTKKIKFLTYLDLKKKAGALNSDNAIVIVDTEKQQADLMIDRKLIRKIELIKSDPDAILVKTKFYKQRIKDAKNPLIRIRGEQLPTPKCIIHSADKKDIFLLLLTATAYT